MKGKHNQRAPDDLPDGKWETTRFGPPSRLYFGRFFSFFRFFFFQSMCSFFLYRQTVKSFSLVPSVFEKSSRRTLGNRQHYQFLKRDRRSGRRNISLPPHLLTPLFQLFQAKCRPKTRLPQKYPRLPTLTPRLPHAYPVLTL